VVTVVAVTRLDDAAEIGDRLRQNEAVIVNLEAAEEAQASRVIDFTLGLCSGMLAEIEQITEEVFLVTPVRFVDGEDGS